MNLSITFDNQIDNDVAITKNCQKGPRAARDPIHPWSGALQFCVNVLKRLLGWSSLALKPTSEYNFDLKTQRDEQNQQKQKARNSANTKLFWEKFLPHFEDKQWTADCWTKGNGPPNQQPLFDMPQNHVKRYSEGSKSITFAHDRLCDP